jgi:hypothetical protein
VLTESFDDRTIKLTDEVLDLLSRRWWQPRRPRDPELRKNLGRLHMALADVRRLAAKGFLDEAGQTELLARLDRVEPASLNADAAGELLEALDLQLVAAGDETFLCSLLEAEYQRDVVEETRLVVTWSDMYEEKPIAASRTYREGQTVGKSELDEARNKLTALYRNRAMAYGLTRADDDEGKATAARSAGAPSRARRLRRAGRHRVQDRDLARGRARGRRGRSRRHLERRLRPPSVRLRLRRAGAARRRGRHLPVDRGRERPRHRRPQRRLARPGRGRLRRRLLGAVRPQHRRADRGNGAQAPGRVRA